MTALPVLAQAQDAGLATDEQILLKQVMTDRKAVYAKNLGLTEAESAEFWPIYDEYEAKVKKVNDRFLANVNKFVENYETLSESDAAAVLKEKMAIEKEREALKQAVHAARSPRCCRRRRRCATPRSRPASTTCCGATSTA